MTITNEQIKLIWQVAMVRWGELGVTPPVTKQDLLLHVGAIAAYRNGDRTSPPDPLPGLSTEHNSDLELLLDQAELEETITLGGTMRYALVEGGLVKGFINSSSNPTVPGFDAIPTYPGQVVQEGYVYDAQDNSFAPLPPLPQRWEAFFKENQILLLALIQGAPQHAIAAALMIEFKSAIVDLDDLILYWGMAGIPAMLTPEQITILNTSASAHHLPVALHDQGVMIKVD